jgi:hypothetical protein
MPLHCSEGQRTHNAEKSKRVRSNELSAQAISKPNSDQATGLSRAFGVRNIVLNILRLWY